MHGLLLVQPGLHGLKRWRQALCSLLRVGHPDMVDLMLGMLQRLLHHGHQRAIGQHGLCAAVLQHIGVVVHGQQGVDGDRHHACVHGAQKRNHPFAHIVHDQQHALFAVYACGRQTLGQAARLILQLRIGQRAVVVGVGDFGGPALVEIKQMLGEVERLGEVDHGSTPDIGLGRVTRPAAPEEPLAQQLCGGRNPEHANHPVLHHHRRGPGRHAGTGA